MGGDASHALDQAESLGSLSTSSLHSVNRGSGCADPPDAGPENLSRDIEVTETTSRAYQSFLPPLSTRISAKQHCNTY